VEHEPEAPPPPPPSSGGPVAASAALLLLGAGAILVAARGAREEPAPPPPVLGEVPPFSLVERHGATVTRDSLRGRVWIADFVFTSCAGVCPEMSLRMAAVQAAVAEDPGTVCVTVTVDPERDTPEVLRAYADLYGASADRWLYLRGTQEEAHRLQFDGFKMGDGKDPLLHSQRFVLVDREGRIRGWYPGTEEEGVRALLRDWRGLRDERAP